MSTSSTNGFNSPYPPLGTSGKPKAYSYSSADSLFFWEQKKNIGKCFRLKNEIQTDKISKPWEKDKATSRILRTHSIMMLCDVIPVMWYPGMYHVFLYEEYIFRYLICTRTDFKGTFEPVNT